MYVTKNIVATILYNYLQNCICSTSFILTSEFYLFPKLLNAFPVMGSNCIVKLKANFPINLSSLENFFVSINWEAPYNSSVNENCATIS